MYFSILACLGPRTGGSRCHCLSSLWAGFFFVICLASLTPPLAEGTRSALARSRDTAKEAYGLRISLHPVPVADGYAERSGPKPTKLSEEDADTVKTAAENPDNPFGQMLVALGGGTGATLGGTGSVHLDRDLERRMRYQDYAVMLLLLMVYLVTLCIGVSLSCWQSRNRSPVTFYADPRYHSMVMEGHTIEGFLEVFNHPPKTVHLQVTGFIPVQEEIDGSVEWQGGHYNVAFTFALDLSSWVVRERSAETPGDRSGGPDCEMLALEDGVVLEDLQRLRTFLGYDLNDLGTVEMQKVTVWPGWEELATNIKQRIRQCGFNGVITVNRNDVECVTVYKNRQWANFLHSRMTKVLAALSIVGWIFYLPYMWWRLTRTLVRCRYMVDLPIADYWPLIADKLSENGFEDRPRALGYPMNGNNSALVGGGDPAPASEAQSGGQPTVLGTEAQLSSATVQLLPLSVSAGGGVADLASSHRLAI